MALAEKCQCIQGGNDGKLLGAFKMKVIRGKWFINNESIC